MPDQEPPSPAKSDQSGDKPRRRASAPFSISSNKVIVTDDALCREHGMDKDGTCLCHPHVMMYYVKVLPSTTAGAAADAGVKTSSTTDDGKNAEGGDQYTIVPCQYCLAAQNSANSKTKSKHTGRQQKHRKKNMLVYDVGQVKDLEIPVVSLEDQQLNTSSDEEDEFMLLSSSPANKPSAFHASFNSSFSNIKKWHNSMNALAEEEDVTAEGSWNGNERMGRRMV